MAQQEGVLPQGQESQGLTSEELIRRMSQLHSETQGVQTKSTEPSMGDQSKTLWDRQNQNQRLSQIPSESPELKAQEAWWRATEQLRDIREYDEKMRHAIENKYKNLDTLEEKKKVEALSHKNINPFLLQNKTDAYNVGLAQWPRIADNAVLNHMSEADKEKTSGKYYDAVVGPLSAMAGSPMSREVWQKQAFKEATQFKLENAYDNSILHDIKHGWNAGWPTRARLGESVYNLLSGFFSTAYEFGKATVSAPKEHTDEEYSPWYHHAQKATEDLSTFSDSKGLGSWVNRGARVRKEEGEFWADALPMKGGWFAKSLGYGTELAGTLPLYWAIGEVTGKVLSPITTPLTTTLTASPAGQKVLQYLVSGGEGLAFGAVTREKGDRHNAWQDALQFMATHAVFEIGGKIVPPIWRATTGVAAGARIPGAAAASARAQAAGAAQAAQRAGAAAARVSAAARAGTQVPPRAPHNLTLLDLVKEMNGEESEEFRDMKRRQDEYELAMQGKRPATSEEVWQQRRKEAATNIAAAGVVGQKAIYMQAFKHLENMERAASKEQVKAVEAALLKKDPAQWSPVLSAANYVRALLGERRFSEVRDDPELMKTLSTKIGTLIGEAATEVPKHVPEVVAEGADEAVEENAKGSGAQTLEYFKAQVQAEAAASGAGAVLTPQQLDAMAKQRWAEAVAKGRARATQEATANPRRDNARAGVVLDSAAFKEAPLPASLRGSKPGYSYGVGNQFRVTWEDPRDMAAYILTGKGKSAAHEEFLEYYKKHFPEMTDSSLNAHGQRVRDYLKKEAKGFSGEDKVLHVPRMQQQEPVKVPPPKMGGEGPKGQGGAGGTQSPPSIFARYRLNDKHNDFLKALATKLGLKGKTDTKAFSAALTQHLEGMSDEEFGDHLQEFFFPDALKAADIYFQSSWAKGIGKEYPNFLAFMYNFKEQMPYELEKELEERLVGTKNFQKAFKPGQDTQPLLDFYSQSIFNTVEDFLHSGPWKDQAAIFSSASRNIKGTTKWQKELLEARGRKEIETLRAALVNFPEAMQAAETNLRALQTKRMEAFNRSYKEDPNSRRTVQELNKLISKEPGQGFNIQPAQTTKYEWPNPKAPDPAEVAAKKAHEEEGRRLKAEKDKTNDERDRLFNESMRALREKGIDSPEYTKAKEAHAKYRDTVYGPANNAYWDWISKPSPHVARSYEPQFSGKIKGTSRGFTGWVSKDVMGKLRQAIYPSRGMSVLHGFSFPRHLLPDLRARIGAASFYYPYKNELLGFIDEFDRMTPAGKPLQFVAFGKRLRELIDTYSEEWLHNAQVEIGGGDIARNLTPTQYTEAHRYIPQGMQEYLNQHYSNHPIDSQVREAAAKFLTQKASKFNCTEDQQLDFIIKYFDMIVDTHGADALLHFAGVARGVGRRVLEAAI